MHGMKLDNTRAAVVSSTQTRLFTSNTQVCTSSEEGAFFML